MLPRWASLLLAYSSIAATVSIPQGEDEHTEPTVEVVVADSNSGQGDGSNIAGKSGVLSFPVLHTARHTTNKGISRRAASDTDVQVYNVTSISYSIELSIGTPGQQVQVAIDTGSSELWVNPNCATAQSQQQTRECIAYGSYDPRDSSSARISSSTSGIRYGIGQVALQYVADDISLPGSDVNLDNVIFGYATASVDLNQGIMGLSFGEGYNMEYPSFIDELYLQNVTKTKAFGVALGLKTEKENSGLLTFGGLDTKKFRGKLHKSEMLQPLPQEGLYRYWVQLDSVGLTDSEGQSQTFANSSTRVFFDTGATLSYLPSNVIRDMARVLGARKDSTVGLWLTPCGQKGSLQFTFGDFTVDVSLDEFIWNLGSNICAMGAEEAEGSSLILGDSFLRSVYTVFDIEDFALYFGQYVNCGTNLQEIPGKDTVLSFEGECSKSDAENTSTQGGSGSSNDDDDDSSSSRLSASYLLAGTLVSAQLLYTLLM